MPFVRSMLTVGLISALAVSAVLYFRTTPMGDPLLSGPPQFIMLAVVVAFAAYIRQVSLHAIEFRDKIVSGNAWKFPREKGYSKDKVAELEKTTKTIGIVSPLMIGMILVVCGRIVIDGVVRIFRDSTQNPRLLYSIDVFATLCLFLAFLGLAIAHFTARRTDTRIQKQAKSEEEPNLAAAHDRDAKKLTAALRELRDFLDE